MGEYFMAVNPVKRQYFSASDFDENFGPLGLLWGGHGLALELLIRDASPTPPVHPLTGAWVGDPVIEVGDYVSPDILGIKTATDDKPDRNLYSLAHDEM